MILVNRPTSIEDTFIFLYIFQGHYQVEVKNFAYECVKQTLEFVKSAADLCKLAIDCLNRVYKTLYFFTRPSTAFQQKVKKNHFSDFMNFVAF